MTRLKKLIVSGLMVLVTSFTFLGASVFNIAQLLFPYSAVMASTFVPGNTNSGEGGAEGTTIKSGDIITVKNIPTQGNKNNKIVLPFVANVTGTEIFTALTKGVIVSPDVEENVFTTKVSDGLASVSTVFVEIRDPYGNPLTSWVEADTSVEPNTPAGFVIADAQVAIDPTSKELSLTPAISGTYSVQYYALSNGVWTNSGEYKIRVTARSFSIDMQNNDSIVMPETVRIDSSNSSEPWAKTEVQIALPLLHDENGELIKDNIVLGGQLGTGTVEDPHYYYLLKYEDIGETLLNAVSPLSLVANDQNAYTSYETYTVQKFAGTIPNECYVLYVEVKSSSSAASKLNYVDLDGDLLTLNDVDENLVTEASPYYAHAYTFNAVGGKNVITYKLSKKVSGGTLNPNSPDSWFKYTVTGSASFDSQNIKLAATTSSTVKASDTSFKEKVYLPSISATNTQNNNNSMNAFYYYVVKKVTTSSTGTSQYAIDAESVEMGRDENGFYFVPNAPSGSVYEISYNVVDFYGNTVTSDENYNYKVTITDRKGPTVNFVKSYNASATSLDESQSSDYSYVVASKYKITTPATAKPTKAEHTEGGVLNTTTYDAAMLEYRNSLTKIYVPAVFATDVSGFTSKRRSLTSDKFKVGGESVNGTININDNSGATNTTSGLASINENAKYLVSFIHETDNAIEFSKYTDTTNGYGYTSGNELRDQKMSDVAVIYLDPEYFGEGEYKLDLVVTDGQYNSNTTSRVFSFSLVKEDFETARPTVEFGNSTVGNVVANQDISIPVPTITDNINTRMLVKYFAVVDDEGINGFVSLSLDSTGKNIVFNTSEPLGDGTIYSYASISSTKSFKVYAFVFNGFVTDVDTTMSNIQENLSALELDTTNTVYPNVGFDSYTIFVKHLNDTIAPNFGTLTAVTTGPATFNQNAEVTIPGVKFYDDTSSARIEVSVVDTRGTSYSYSLIDTTNAKSITATPEGYKYEYDFAGIKFTPTNADRGNYYTVTYTLRDQGQNVVSYSFVLLHATDKEGPTIQGIPGADTTIELGEVITFSEITAVDNYYETSSITFKVKSVLIGDQGEQIIDGYYDNINNVFTPRKAGKYQIKITAFDGAENSSAERIFTVNVKDTTNPIIEVGYNGVFAEADFEEEGYPTVTFNVSFYDDLPKFPEINDFGVKETKITIKAPSNDSSGLSEYVYDAANGELISSTTNVLDLEKIDSENFSFKPTARGKYTITFSCKDLNNNSATKSIEVDIGDTMNPEILLSNALKTKLNNGFILSKNNSLNINTRTKSNVANNETEFASEDITVRDNYGFNFNSEGTGDSAYNYVKVDVTISDSSNNTVTANSTTNDIYTYEFKTAGTYTMTFKVTDKVGNRETFTRTFTVSADTTSGIDATTIIGTVLIVVSAVILLGVLIYFVKGTKFISKKKVLKKDIKKDTKKD